MTITEFNQEVYEKSIWEQGLEQGLQQGMEQGLQQGMEQGLQQGMEQGLEQGLQALVMSLSLFISDTDALYQAVIQNENYKNISKEHMLKYL